MGAEAGARGGVVEEGKADAEDVGGAARARRRRARQRYSQAAVLRQLLQAQQPRLLLRRRSSRHGGLTQPAGGEGDGCVAAACCGRTDRGRSETGAAYFGRLILCVTCSCDLPCARLGSNIAN